MRRNQDKSRVEIEFLLRSTYWEPSQPASKYASTSTWERRGERSPGMDVSPWGKRRCGGMGVSQSWKSALPNNIDSISHVVGEIKVGSLTTPLRVSIVSLP